MNYFDFAKQKIVKELKGTIADVKSIECHDYARNKTAFTLLYNHITDAVITINVDIEEIPEDRYILCWVEAGMMHKECLIEWAYEICQLENQLYAIMADAHDYEDDKGNYEFINKTEGK